MGRKGDQIRIRCESETRHEWKRFCVDLDPDADYEEIVETILIAYREEPDLFQRVHEFGPALGGY